MDHHQGAYDEALLKLQFYLFLSHKYPLCLTVVLETYSIKSPVCVGGNLGTVLLSSRFSIYRRMTSTNVS